jgi:hypothetical protein
MSALGRVALFLCARASVLGLLQQACARSAVRRSAFALCALPSAPCWVVRA